MRRTRLRRLATWAGLGVSAVFAYLSFRDVDFGSFWDTLARGEYWLLLPATAVLALAIYLRAVRWRVLFVREPRPPMDAVTSSLLIGYLLNSILPARAGEAARVIALNQRAGTSRSEALATVVAERLLDVLALLALLLAAAPFVTEAAWLRSGATVGAVAFLVLTGVLVALAVHGERPVRFVLRPLAALPSVSSDRVADVAANLVQGLAVFRRPGLALRAMALTTVSWLVIPVSFWLAMRAVRLDEGVDAALLVVIAVNLALILPSGPAGLGVFEAAVVLTLTRFGVERSEALSYAVVVHVVQVVPLMVVGYVALHRHARAVRRSQSSRSGLNPPVAAGPSELGAT